MCMMEIMDEEEEEKKERMIVEVEEVEKLTLVMGIV